MLTPSELHARASARVENLKLLGLATLSPKDHIRLLVDERLLTASLTVHVDGHDRLSIDLNAAQMAILACDLLSKSRHLTKLAYRGPKNA